jgi:hypothetical protein
MEGRIAKHAKLRYQRHKNPELLHRRNWTNAFYRASFSWQCQRLVGSSGLQRRER